MIPTLTHDIQVTEIHGVTGQELADGVLDAGARIRGLRQGHDTLGQALWHFDASQDNGQTWYKYQSYEQPETA